MGGVYAFRPGFERVSVSVDKCGSDCSPQRGEDGDRPRVRDIACSGGEVEGLWHVARLGGDPGMELTEGHHPAVLLDPFNPATSEDGFLVALERVSSEAGLVPARLRNMTERSSPRNQLKDALGASPSAGAAPEVGREVPKQVGRLGSSA